MKCPYCDMTIADDMGFCGYCGKPVGHSKNSSVQTGNIDGYAIAAMVLGIISVSIYPLGIILGALGIAFGRKALKMLRLDVSKSGEGFAKAGLICGIVGLIISLMFWILYLLLRVFPPWSA